MGKIMILLKCIVFGMMFGKLSILLFSRLMANSDYSAAVDGLLSTKIRSLFSEVMTSSLTIRTQR